MPNLGYVIETARWTRSVDGAPATIRLKGRCPHRSAPLVLEELIERAWDRDTGLTVRFDSDVAEPLRVGITAAVAHLIRATAPDGLVEGASEVEGWIGPRYTIDDRLEPSFGFVDTFTDRDRALIGLWVNPRAFVVVAISDGDIEPSGECWAALSHWNPGSMTSGMFGSSIHRIEPGLRCDISNRDEGGSYFSFGPAPDDPEEIARTIRDLITDDDARGAEGWFPTLYALVGEDVDDLTPFTGGMLPGTESDEYRIERLHIDPPGDAAEALRRIASPTAEELAALRETLLAYAGGPDDATGLENLGPLWRWVAGIA